MTGLPATGAPATTPADPDGGAGERDGGEAAGRVGDVLELVRAGVVDLHVVRPRARRQAANEVPADREVQDQVKRLVEWRVLIRCPARYHPPAGARLEQVAVDVPPQRARLRRAGAGGPLQRVR